MNKIWLIKLRVESSAQTQHILLQLKNANTKVMQVTLFHKL